MPSKEIFHMMIKAISILSFLCFPFSFLSAQNQDRDSEQGQKSQETIGEIRPAESKPESKIQSTQTARKRRNEKIFVPSQSASRDIDDILKMRIFPVDI